MMAIKIAFDAVTVDIGSVPDQATTAVNYLTLQEGYWRAVLFGEHVERRQTEGKTFNENAKTEMTVTQQESLMRLFAVCNLQHMYLAACIFSFFKL